jgi:hypothetical protein
MLPTARDLDDFADLVAVAGSSTVGRLRDVAQRVVRSDSCVATRSRMTSSGGSVTARGPEGLNEDDRRLVHVGVERGQRP